MDVLRRLPRSRGVPASFSERMETAWELGRLADNVASRQINTLRIAKDAGAELERRTGISLQGSLPGGGMPDHHEAYVTELEQEAQRIAKMRPDIDLSDLPLTRDAIMDAYKREAQDAQTRSDLQELQDPGLSGGQLLGSIGALVTDPVLLPALFMGASASTTVIRGMAIESGIAASVEAAAQIPIQLNRKDLGLPYGVTQALANIGGASLGAAGIYGATRVGSAAFRKLLDSLDLRNATPEQKAAFSALDDLQRSVETVTVRDPSPTEIAAHQRNLDQALVDLQSGRVANIAGINRADLPADLMRAGEVRDALMPVMRAVGLEIDELVPGLVNAMRINSDFVDIAFTRGVVDDMTERVAKLAGQEQAVSEAVLKANTKLAEALEARTALDARLQVVESLLRRSRNARRDDELTPTWARVTSKDDLEVQALSVLDTPAWERKIRERGIDTPEVRRALKRKLQELQEARGGADTRVASAKREAATAGDDLAGFHRRAAKAGARMRDRIASRFSDEELARMNRSAREVVGPADRQIAEQSVEEEQVAEALIADPVATQGATLQARADLESMKGRMDDDLAVALRDEMDKLDEMDALETEVNACLRGLADA